MKLIPFIVLCALGLSACGGGGGIAPPSITVSGTVRFESIPFDPSLGQGLSYSARSFKPARGVTIVVGSNCGSGVRATTDENGNFSVAAPENSVVSINVCAEMISTASATWDVEVINNTNDRAQYAARFTRSTSDTDENLGIFDLPSGWSDSSNSYTSARVSGPFAILDAIYDAIQKTVAVDPDAQFPQLKVNWSINNTTVSGDIAAGNIGTSHYRGGSVGEMFILGKENNDTDEFDRHVVIHEWGHYFEDRFSRSDSIGGPHSLGEKLDMRVAFGEGFGNALSGIVTDDPVYRDSSGASQSGDFAIDVESNSAAGWYSESTVQSILYDIYDANGDGDDALSLGWKPLYETFVDTDYTSHSAFTSIFPYFERFNQLNPSSAAVLNGFLAGRSVNSTEGFAAGESNDGGLVGNTVLPVYTNIPLNTAVTFCSSAEQGVYNKLGNRRFGLFQTGNATRHRITTSSDASPSDTDIYIYLRGAIQAELEVGGEEDRALTLEPNSLYTFDISDFNFGANGGRSGVVCSTVTVSQI